MPRPRRRDPDAVAEAVRRAVRAALAAHWNKKPICHVHVLEYERAGGVRQQETKHDRTA